LNVSLTFDVEVWCGSWDRLDERFPDAFQRYVYGENENGHALPKTLEILARHGLRGVFFVEPLFSYRFGIEPLREIVGLIQDAGHSVQLHLHPEWVDECSPAILDSDRKRPYLHQYSLAEQTRLIAAGMDALRRGGAPRPSAFRAGSYAANRDTLKALAANGIAVDSSINVSYPGSAEDLNDDERNPAPKMIDGVAEFPVSVFRDGLGKSRHWQVGAAGVSESRSLVQQASAAGYRHLVLVSHNFEMLIPGSRKRDPIVVERFDRLCRWLSQQPRVDVTTEFDTGLCTPSASAPEIRVPLHATAGRVAAQVCRRGLEALA
jgi:hypothetical protein